MKEQVILDREEYLKIKELADKNKADIEKMQDEIKEEFLREIFDAIFNGIYEGRKEVMWGVDVDLPEIKSTWLKRLQSFNKNINDKFWDKAIGSLQSALKELIAENSMRRAKEELTQSLADTVRHKMNEFNSLPWYKKIFYKV